MTRRSLLSLLSLPLLAQQPEDYVCPMDPDVRSATPGVCKRCGMKLVLGIPDEIEYPMDVKATPTQLTFTIRNPKTNKPVTDFEIVHEKLFHLFVVSQDLNFFLHDHPQKQPNGCFTLPVKLPPGQYRLLADFYPKGATPQLIPRTIILPGTPVPFTPPVSHNNMEVTLRTEPEAPIAGMKTLMFFHVSPADGLEPYLGAWGHMLSASTDLIDMIHNHPFLADGGPDIQFNQVFPRPGTYKVWVQFQRKGVVNTAVFNVPVTDLR